MSIYLNNKKLYSTVNNDKSKGNFHYIKLGIIKGLSKLFLQLSSYFNTNSYRRILYYMGFN